MITHYKRAMNEVYTLLFMFLTSGILGFKLLEYVVDPPTAFLISMVFTTLLCVGVVKLKESITYDSTFSNLILDGNTSIGPNFYEDSGNNLNRAYLRFRNLNVVSGNVRGNIAY